ncbi:MAG TPA: radical SAM protein [Thermoleophilaceae bacterium]
MGSVAPLTPFIVKVASRCNLNCSYCYVYNQADATWRTRPALMSADTFDAVLTRIRRHCESSGQRELSIVFHGGEPTLIGARRFASMCARAREQLGDMASVGLEIQTNGTRLDDEWVEAFREHEVRVGISLDGPREINDTARVDHKGRGSYDAVARGIGVLRDGELPFGILSVVQLGADPLSIHRHFLELGCQSISYLLPAYTHDTIGPVREKYGPTPVADYLIPIFDDWWENSTIDVSIREFWAIGRAIMGGSSGLDSFGNPPLRFISIETDGSIHGLDKLRTCEDGMTGTALNVHEADFRDIAAANSLHARILAGMPLPTGCRGCPEQNTCGGGYLPHRYSREREFDNPSVWCADLLALFAHVRGRMEVPAGETLTPVA